MIDRPIAGETLRGCRSDSNLQITELVQGDSAAYEAFIRTHPLATMFHGPAWKRAVESAFGHRAVYLASWREATLTGVLPIFEVRSLLAGRLLVSVPYAIYGGVLADDEASAGALLSAGKKLAVDLDARSLELRSIIPADPALTASSTHATFRKDLPDSESELERFLPRKARAAARRAAERESLTTEFDPAGLDTVWQLYARSMRRLGSVNYPRQFFVALCRELASNLVVQIVRQYGRAVAGLVSFIDRDVMMPYFVGFDERVEIYGLSQYLYLESMRWALRRGCRVYDFGRSRVDNRGAYEFKRLCGFEPQVLGYQSYIPNGRTAPDLSAGSAKWSVARRAWRCLPLAIARPLGAWLSRSIPG